MSAQRFHLAGVMGWPIHHSRSPIIHRAWMAQYGMAGDYVPFAVQPGNLEKALRALAPLGLSGCNLTIPHKEEALRIVDRLDEAARSIGAVNCVVVDADGLLTGRNYDAFGFIESVRSSAPGWRADKGPAVVLGAGGAARAIIFGLRQAGARDIVIVNRTDERAQALASEFGATCAPWSARADVLAGAAMLVNTTALGMVGQPPLDLALGALPKDALVADIVYAPLTTPLLADARAHGATTVDGLGMLIHQARPAFRDWFGVMPEASADLRARLEASL
ncbi:MAG: shikimate dehydrogenase [Hyphomicrobiales bacterium]|nr:shikimate dehydrogenase [Hyphomicrobiales bacterium]